MVGQRIDTTWVAITGDESEDVILTDEDGKTNHKNVWFLDSGVCTVCISTKTDSPLISES